MPVQQPNIQIHYVLTSTSNVIQLHTHFMQLEHLNKLESRVVETSGALHHRPNSHNLEPGFLALHIGIDLNQCHTIFIPSWKNG